MQFSSAIVISPVRVSIMLSLCTAKMESNFHSHFGLCNLLAAIHYFKRGKKKNRGNSWLSDF